MIAVSMRGRLPRRRSNTCCRPTPAQVVHLQSPNFEQPLNISVARLSDAACVSLTNFTIASLALVMLFPRLDSLANDASSSGLNGRSIYSALLCSIVSDIFRRIACRGEISLFRIVISALVPSMSSERCWSRSISPARPARWDMVKAYSLKGFDFFSQLRF